MKIRDIINEGYKGFHGKMKEFGSTRGSVDEAIPGARIEPQIRNTDTYMQMRYGIALAAAAAQRDGSNDNFEQESPWAENIGMIAYTDADTDQIKAADKIMGVSSVEISKRGSQERTDINTVSPVASTKWKTSNQ